VTLQAATEQSISSRPSFHQGWKAAFKRLARSDLLLE
jgi:hypothetical protein